MRLKWAERNMREGYCHELVWHKHSYGGTQCTRKATIGNYCRQHDPEAVAAKRKARDDASNARWKEREDGWGASLRNVKRLGMGTACEAGAVRLTGDEVEELLRRLRKADGS